MPKKDAVRKQVKELKIFYMDLGRFAMVNAALIFLWLLFDRQEPFWPKYVIVIWGSVLVFEAYRRGLVHVFYQSIDFLTPEWEEKKVNQMLGKKRDQWKIPLKSKKYK